MKVMRRLLGGSLSHERYVSRREVLPEPRHNGRDTGLLEHTEEPGLA